jgi:hypothetical protein
MNDLSMFNYLVSSGQGTRNGCFSIRVVFRGFGFFWLGQETLRGNMDQEFFSSRLFLMGVDGGEGTWSWVEGFD